MFGKKSIILYLAIAVVVVAAAFLFIKLGAGGNVSTGNEGQGLDIKVSDKYLAQIKDCKQLVLVTAPEYVNSDTTVRAYEKEGSTCWQQKTCCRLPSLKIIIGLA